MCVTSVYALSEKLVLPHVGVLVDCNHGVEFSGWAQLEIHCIRKAEA